MTTLGPSGSFNELIDQECEYLDPEGSSPLPFTDIPVEKLTSQGEIPKVAQLDTCIFFALPIVVGALVPMPHEKCCYTLHSYEGILDTTKNDNTSVGA